MASLFDVLAAVNAYLTVDAVERPITIRVGPEWLAAADAPPRVVWVPGADRYADGQQQVVLDTDVPPTADQLFSEQVGRYPRQSIATIHASVAAHIWSCAPEGTVADQVDAQAWRSMEKLRDQVLGALREAWHGAYRVTGGGSVAQQGAEVTQFGRLYVLELTFDLPVFEVEEYLLAEVREAELVVVEDFAGVEQGDVEIHIIGEEPTVITPSRVSTVQNVTGPAQTTIIGGSLVVQTTTVVGSFAPFDITIAGTWNGAAWAYGTTLHDPADVDLAFIAPELADFVLHILLVEEGSSTVTWTITS